MSYISVNLVEESMRMIEGLQQVAHIQSSQYMMNEVQWVGSNPFIQYFSWNSWKWTNNCLLNFWNIVNQLAS